MTNLYKTVTKRELVPCINSFQFSAEEVAGVYTASPRYVGYFNLKLENFLKEATSSLTMKEGEQ